MFRMNRDKLANLLTEASETGWHDKDYAKWFAAVVAVLIAYAARARRSGELGEQPSESIVWDTFQCVSHPDDERAELQERLDWYKKHSFDMPEDLANGPTPDQRAEDTQRLNGYVRRLFIIFGVQKAAAAALDRMQAREKPFYVAEHWERRKDWIRAEFLTEPAVEVELELETVTVTGQSGEPVAETA